MNAIRAAIARLLARYRRRPATPTRADGAWSRLEQSVERDPIAAWGGSVPRRPYRATNQKFSARVMTWPERVPSTVPGTQNMLA